MLRKPLISIHNVINKKLKPNDQSLICCTYDRFCGDFIIAINRTKNFGEQFPPLKEKYFECERLNIADIKKYNQIFLISVGYKENISFCNDILNGQCSDSTIFNKPKTILLHERHLNNYPFTVRQFKPLDR